MEQEVLRMPSFNYAGRGQVASFYDGQEMGNLLNKLTHVVNIVFYWTKTYIAINKISLPPPYYGHNQYSKSFKDPPKGSH